MPSSKKFRIRIPDPCRAGKEQFTAHSKGLYCAQCQKCVVDYTQYSDRQLYEHVRGGGSGCGIFTKTQLSKVYKAKTEKPGWKLSALLFSGMALSGFSSKAQDSTAGDSTYQQSLVQDDTTASETVSDDSLEVSAENSLPDSLDSTSIQVPEFNPSIITTFPEIHIETIVFGNFIEVYPVYPEIVFETPIDSIKGHISDALAILLMGKRPFSPDKNPLERKGPAMWMERIFRRFRRKGDKKYRPKD